MRAANVLAVVLGLLMLTVLGPFRASGDSTTFQPSEEGGPTDRLGGGDHLFVRFGADAAFGVLWGTEAHPNHVYLVAIKARHLGVADVKTSDGRVLDEDRTVKVYTIYAIRLDSFFEFDDANGDGIASYRRAYDAENYTTYIQTEPLYKRVSLSTAWNASDVARTEDAANGVRTWTFTLTATNLTYDMLGGGNPTGVLDEVAFTFHLKTTTVHVDNVTVPQYTITVERQGLRWIIMNASRDGSVTWSGDRLAYEVKWDQRIEGWDYDPTNQHPALVLEMPCVVANRLPTTRPAWLDLGALLSLNESGQLRWREENGFGSANETSPYLSPRRLHEAWIRAGGEWTYVGRLTWVSNATVDGSPAQVYAQIQGGIFGRIVTREGAYVGFALLVGLSFPGGNVIEHDPAMDSDAFEPVASQAASAQLAFLVFLLILVTAIIVVIIFAVGRRRSRELPPR